ncbi:hypothetical protein [Sporomusa acidovorans]|uniref:Uncharacterized protein n=1 Tax=Sporomusa acidovorans (strain ATCC 49682 / DSM 3132 / Mol) TaxID=1123286 RepID=A0ABZ3J5E6_SPOA4|nr:hypothetical protein [Sporomusa acidovorans]OZC16376.1 hypothetical protein SPACI_42740 [Sporomusa acidovorans DSM 3132]SDF00553.1 hypothetical protein SAMN04488499_102943 [Sporomusa acidovorans]
MFARVNANSDILENGKIMLYVDSDPGCYTLTDLQYLEHALRELLVDIYRGIQETKLKKNNLSFESYVAVLSSLANNLKIITDSLLAVKKAIEEAKHEADGPAISNSFINQFVEYSTIKTR